MSKGLRIRHGHHLQMGNTAPPSHQKSLFSEHEPKPYSWSAPRIGD